MKNVLFNLKIQIKICPLVVYGFNTPLFSIDRSFEQKKKPERLELHDIIHQMDLTDAEYSIQTPHPTR